jgi:hypothetical protein
MQDNIPEISPSLFNWESYLSKRGYSGADLFTNWRQGRDFKINPEFKIIGWCPSNRLTIRPRTTGKAIMLEDSFGEKVWAHWTE